MARKKKESKLFYFKYHDSPPSEPLPELELCSVDVDRDNIIDVITGVESEWVAHTKTLEQWNKELDRSESGRPWLPELETQLNALVEDGVVKEKTLVEEGLLDE